MAGSDSNGVVRQDGRMRWSSIRTLAEEGDWQGLSNQYTEEYIRYRDHLERIHEDFNSKPVALDKIINEWHWSESCGMDKFVQVYDKYPGAYKVDESNGWNGYLNEETVIVECIPRNLNGFHWVKSWASPYPFPCVRDGATQYIRPKRIVVISNYSPVDAIWRMNSNDIDLIRCRFPYVFRYGGKNIFKSMMDASRELYRKNRVEPYVDIRVGTDLQDPVAEYNDAHANDDCKRVNVNK